MFLKSLSLIFILNVRGSIWHCVAATKILGVRERLRTETCLVLSCTRVGASPGIYHSVTLLGTVSSSGAGKNAM